jgi:hypothetical protein
VLLCGFSLFYQVNKRSIFKTDLAVILLFVFLFCFYILLSKSTWNNTLSYYSVIFLSIILYLVLKKSSVNRYALIELWVKLGYVLSYFFIIVFFLNQFTSLDTDYFNFENLMSYSNRNYEYSFFGVSQVKNMSFISIVRVSGYFPEPQYAGFYFIINIIISSFKSIKHRYPKWGLLIYLQDY